MIKDRNELIEMGFKEMPHFTIMNYLNYDLGRNRQLSIGCLGTPNEMMFISQLDKEPKERVTDTIILSNYDYDGYLDLEKVEDIINVIINR